MEGFTYNSPDMGLFVQPKVFKLFMTSDKYMATIGKTISNHIHDKLYGPRSDKRDLMAENSILITYERPCHE